MTLYGIGEWYGERFSTMPATRRREFASIALSQGNEPDCPFRRERTPCSKQGGVCTLQKYKIVEERIASSVGEPVIVCPYRFDQDDLIPHWLAEIAGFDQVYLAHEVPFMRAPTTGREAGRIDLVLAGNTEASEWYGLEIQAVYFSGASMKKDFELLLHDQSMPASKPTARRRPDWRSSSAKRLMPQLEVKVPTLRQWGKKLAVAVDLPFFEAIGGASASPSHDIYSGDVIWLVPRLLGGRLQRYHWEVLSLEASSRKLLAADPVRRKDFEADLRRKLKRLDGRAKT